MKMKLICLLLPLLLLSGCELGDLPDKTDGPQQLPASAPASAESEKTQAPETEAPAKADWFIEVNDTQKVTQDETGLVFYYTLKVNIAKSGGANASGRYVGQISLNVEEDKESAAALLGEDA